MPKRATQAPQELPIVAKPPTNPRLGSFGTKVVLVAVYGH